MLFSHMVVVVVFYINYCVTIFESFDHSLFISLSCKAN